MTKRVPTNILTGFLGVGKTTTILNLLKNKPQNESWAVLVNEFGEIGIDGAMMADQGALIKEVPGGCMCCTAGVPMSVGINALLRQKPDRLIIEPTGLGHPKQVISKLLSEQYLPYVDLKATIALLDPRNLSDEKYLENQNFNDQLASADIIVANKVDLCSQDDLDCFERWLEKQAPAKLKSVKATDGVIPHSLLELERSKEVASSKAGSHHHHHEELEAQLCLPPGEAYIRKANKGQGYYSCGWLFSAEHRFDFDGMFAFLMQLPVERIKAVVNTEKGCYAYNVANGVVSVNEMNLDGFESRLEVIDQNLVDADQIESVLKSMVGL